VESRVLKALGLIVVDTNEVGKRSVRVPTLFYMIHCPMQLYNNVVWANWGSSLRNVAIVGNSFATYNEVLDSTKRQQDLACVIAALPWSDEKKLEVPEDLFYSFNNTRCVRLWCVVPASWCRFHMCLSPPVFISLPTTRCSGL